MNAETLKSLIHIAIILSLSLLGYLALSVLSHRLERQVELRIAVDEQQKRLKTLLQAGRSFGTVVILLVMILMILYELQINILPILASAGVAGLALSLGAQTFIKDFFGGIVVLVENQFTVGDTIRVGEHTGTVERITLRATYLRDLEGNRIAIPNGDIRTVSNLSAEWARAVVTLSVPIAADIERVTQALHQAAETAGQDASIAPFLLAPPEAQGWVDLTETAVRVRLTARTKPGKQWQVAQALRKHALLTLQSNISKA